MARDNSPKERQRRHLERKLGQRAAYDRILIVTEGSKTEPNYFREIRNAYRLHTANVSVHPGALGTAPIHVVDYARQLFEGGDRHKQIAPRAFDQVYAVFDRDAHESYHEALQRAEQLDGKLRSDARRPVPFKAVASVPSFELWLLLHYENIQAPILSGELSVLQAVLLGARPVLFVFDGGGALPVRASRTTIGLDLSAEDFDAFHGRFGNRPIATAAYVP